MATQKNFEGQSPKSIEDAISNAIKIDPKNDPGTDIYNYEVTKFKVVFGGFALTTTYHVTLERP